MTPVVIALAGRIGAGKSSVSHELASVLSWPRVSFGEYVRQVARGRELGMSREALQNLGSRLIDEGWHPFVRGVVGMAHDPARGLIVDGIRHKAALDTLRAVVAPIRVWAGYLRVDDSVRRRRLAQRGDDQLDLDRAEAHAVERELGEVAAVCDEQVDADGSIEEVTRRILRSLEGLEAGNV